MFAQQLVNGLLLGSAFALIALSFNLVVGTLDRLNFALGETAMVSAIAASVLLSQFELAFPLALLAALAVGAAVSLLTYLVSFRFVSPSYPTAPILSSLGVGLILSSVVTRLLGSEQRRIPAVLEMAIPLGPLRVSGDQLIILGVAAALTALFYVVLERTAWGTALRGVSDGADTAALLGVPVQKVILLTFLLSGLLAGAAGLLTGLAFHAVSPFDGFSTTLTALMIIVLGGLGNVTGGVVAAMLIGLVDTLTVVFLSATARDLVVFVMVAVLLVVRPQGLFGRHHAVEDRV